MRRRLREGTPVTFGFAPMVDVVLLVVIFFMLTSTLDTGGVALPLDLPRAANTVRDSGDLPTVSVDADGKIFLEGRAIALVDLENALRPLARDSRGVVALRADERGNYGRVVAVMDAIKQAGGERLALGTRRP